VHKYSGRRWSIECVVAQAYPNALATWSFARRHQSRFHLHLGDDLTAYAPFEHSEPLSLYTSFENHHGSSASFLVLVVTLPAMAVVVCLVGWLSLTFDSVEADHPYHCLLSSMSTSGKRLGSSGIWDQIQLAPKCARPILDHI
jgi:hypothetical protein